ncbi:MAG TPA: 4-hydroxy-tetrahydrodipicolinate reductase [Nocardioidaceae bacterium]|nr:4-hydroxy-tetrahydrodipicolinate reductase [Nocardioidaceae bacterium]
MRVAVLGARGRMGTAACTALNGADGLELVARVDLGDGIAALAGTGAEVAVDFTRPDAVLDNVEWCVRNGIHVVVGTSGLTDDRLTRVRTLLDDHPGVSVLVVPNFSIGAVLAMRFARQAAPFFESVEVVEMHHPDKVDAPSGTARRTAALVAQARAEAGLGPVPDATTDDPDGARGARVQGVAVHALRVRGLTASQEVVLGGPGETLTVRHDSHDREAFMPGVLSAVRAVADRPGLTVGLDTVLGLD